MKTSTTFTFLSSLMTALLCVIGTPRPAIADIHEYHLTVHTDRPTGALPHFWRGTGFTPAGLLENEQMKITMAHFDGVPHAGIAWVRIHDLLTLVRVESLDTTQPTYDWSVLDRAMDQIRDAGMRPFFELMGSPEGYVFNDMHDPNQVRAMRRLVRDLARHYIDRYGLDEVRSWYFEVWNEPDITPYFNHPWAKDDLAGLIRYYDACSAGLMDADPGLRFGGPGTALTLSSMFTGLMEHLDAGTNHLTGQSPPRCDFISIHEKGGGPSTEPMDPDTGQVFTSQNKTIAYLREHHPRLAQLPLINNECDPLVGWRDDHAWRGTSYYPACIASIVHRQLDITLRQQAADFALMSNDHGFLGGWSQRSVMVPFTQDGIGETESAGASMVKKPVLEGMNLLALLGDRTVDVIGLDPGSELTCLATLTPAGDLVLLVNHFSDDSSAKGTANVTIEVQAGSPRWDTLSIRRIDPKHANPKHVWETYESPKRPTPEVLHTIREAAETPCEVAAYAGEPIRLELPMHSLALVILTRDYDRPPPPVRSTRARVVAGLHGPEALVRWQEGGNPRRLKGYRVEAITSEGVVPLHVAMPISTTLVRPLPDHTAGLRMYAVDLWGRVSEPVVIPIFQPTRNE